MALDWKGKPIKVFQYGIEGERMLVIYRRSCDKCGVFESQDYQQIEPQKFLKVPEEWLCAVCRPLEVAAQ
jgi:hypothetical protein